MDKCPICGNTEITETSHVKRTDAAGFHWDFQYYVFGCGAWIEQHANGKIESHHHIDYDGYGCDDDLQVVTEQRAFIADVVNFGWVALFDGGDRASFYFCSACGGKGDALNPDSVKHDVTCLYVRAVTLLEKYG